MKLKDNSTQEIDTALYQLEQRLKSNIRLTDVENSNASSAKINAVDKKLTEEVKDRQSADGKLQDNINKEIADRQEADAAIENAKQDKLIAGDNIQINGNIISATSKEYTAEAPVKVTDGIISLDTVPITKGGTGVTTQEDINKAFIGNLEVGNSDVTDGTEFVSSYVSENGFADPSALNKPYKRQFIKVWNYIKGKISSVLGLTADNYGGKANTAGNADTVDNYHASQLWRSDGATWNPKANVSLNAAANGDEWSFDIHRNGHTGCYWQVWDENKNTLLKVNADDGKVAAPYGFVGNLSGKASTAGKASFLDEYVGAGGTRLTSGNIKPKDSSEFGGMRKDVVTSSMTDSGNPGQDGHLLTMFWDNAGRWDSQFFVSNSNPPVLKSRGKGNKTDYGAWTDVITSDNIGSQTVAKAGNATTADKATNDGNGNNIVNTYALKSNLQYTKSIDIIKVDGSSDTLYYLIAKTSRANNVGNIDSIFVNGSDFINRMFEGSIRTRGGNFIYNYGKNNLPIELYEQTDGAIYVYWLVSDAYNKVALNITATAGVTTYGGNLSPVTPTGSKMTLNEYDYKSYGVLPVARGGTGETTANAAANAFINSLTTGTDIPKDADYYVCQSVGGGTTTTTYHRRPVSKLWEYIKGKISSVLGLTEDTIATLRTNADAGYLCKLYQLASAAQSYNVILLGKIPDPASTAAPATPASSWDIDVDFYFVRSQGHKASWCNVKAGYGYSNAWRKYGSIETFGVDSNSNYLRPFDLVTLKYNNEYYIGVRHTVDIDGSYAARVKYVNTNGSRNPSTVNNTSLVNMLKVIPYQKTTDGTILNNEIKTSIADFPNTYAPTVIRNGNLVLPSGYARVGNSGVAGSKLTIQGKTVNSNSYTDTNPKLEFKNDDGSQNISLTFNDFDAVQAPASLTLNGNQGGEYFIAPNIKATTKFIGNLTGNVTGNVSGSSGSASKLTTARTAYVDLGTASTTRTIDWSGDTTIPVDGVLQVEHGGTGATTAEAAANSLIASLAFSDRVPVDSDYFISQVVNGGPFVPGYERRPISKLWEYIKGKILQEGEEFGYNHIVHDGDSLLEWANCTDGSMKKVLIKSGTYNITKVVNLSQAGTSYVLAENGAVINSHVPIAFTASSGKTVVHNLNVVCDGAANGDNTCAFSADNPENLILYDCSATYRTYTEIVNRSLFVSCTCYNCSYAFQNLPANSSISMKVFYQCRCYNCKCLQTIAANSSTGISFYNESYFYKECHCASCDAELTTSRNIKAATNTFACYYNCYDRCVGCLSKINVNSKALTVYSTLYGFLRCQYMSSCKETHTEGYTNIKGIVQCDFISSTTGINGSSNTHVGNSCSIQ